LGSIVISGVIGLIDLEEGKHLLNTDKKDFIVWIVAFFGTMFLGVEVGLGNAVGLSLIIVLCESAYPNLPVLGRLPGTNVYRNTKQYSDAITYPGIVICRIDAPIYFANTQNIRDKIEAEFELAAGLGTATMVANEEVANEAEEIGDPASTELLTPLTRTDEIRYIVIDMSPVPYIDTAGVKLLEEVLKDYSDRDVRLCFCNPEISVMNKLRASGLIAKIGINNIYCNTYDAVKSCLAEMEPEPEKKKETTQDIESVSSLEDNTFGREDKGSVFELPKLA